MNWLQKIARIQVQIGNVQPMPITTSGEKVIETAQGEEIKRIVETAIKSYYNRFDPEGYKFISTRYSFVLDKWTEDYNGVLLSLRILPFGGKPGTEEIAKPDDPSYDYYQKWTGGKTNRTIYKTPQDAIKQIPADPNLAYRGMAWEEWQSIRKTGFVQSRGVYNLGDEQSNYTMFGYTPDTGEHYAHGFAPLQYQTSFKRPSVVISVPKNLLLTHQDDPKGIPTNELACKGPLSSSQIKSVWMLIPTSSKTGGGTIEFRLPWVKAWEDKETPTGIFKIDPTHATMGSGNLSVITGYAIRQLQ
jgi:hypothetical protein